MQSLFPMARQEVAPGAVHLPGWLTTGQQRRLVEAWREWAAGPAPMRALRLPGGRTMSVQMVCLGWQWLPYHYTRTADDLPGRPPIAAFPGWLVDLGRSAVRDAYDDLTTGADYTPDAALVNYYDEAARLGMHQDKDERSDAPVVSLSLGDTCVFRFGNTEHRNRPFTDLQLRSGDLFVFGGPSRFAYHGVTKTFPGTANPEIGLDHGRLNLTLRVTGLDG